MAKKRPPESAGPAPAELSARGKKVISLGAAALAAGFILLSRAGLSGRDWRADAASFLVLGAYALIGLGLFL